MVVGETSKRTHDSFESETPTSRIAFQRAAAVMPGGAKGAYYYAPYPLFFERGDGCRVTDVDGREFLDFANHHTAQILGHNHPAVSEAINRQVGRGVVLGGPTGPKPSWPRKCVAAWRASSGSASATRGPRPPCTRSDWREG